MNIFENVIFIGERAVQRAGELTPDEKVKLRTNLKKACIENEKINKFNNSIGSIRSVPKERLANLLHIFGVIEEVEPFTNPSRITVIFDKSGKEIAMYLETPGYVNAAYYSSNDHDIQDFIIASIEYKLGIKVFTDMKYFK